MIAGYFYDVINRGFHYTRRHASVFQRDQVTKEYYHTCDGSNMVKQVDDRIDYPIGDRSRELARRQSPNSIAQPKIRISARENDKTIITRAENLCASFIQNHNNHIRVDMIHLSDAIDNLFNSDDKGASNKSAQWRQLRRRVQPKAPQFWHSLHRMRFKYNKGNNGSLGGWTTPVTASINNIVQIILGMNFGDRFWIHKHDDSITNPQHYPAIATLNLRGFPYFAVTYDNILQRFKISKKPKRNTAASNRVHVPDNVGIRMADVMWAKQCPLQCMEFVPKNQVPGNANR